MLERQALLQFLWPDKSEIENQKLLIMYLLIFGRVTQSASGL
jgi:hypothetical protein